MSYIVYKTTNIINGRYYVGVHNGRDPYYKGSGKALKAAFKKYGRANFVCETLETFESREAAFAREAQIVTSSFVADKNTYNLIEGGIGGIGHTTREETKRKISNSLKGRSQSAETKRRKSKAAKGRPKPPGFSEKVQQSNSNRAPAYKFIHPIHGIYEGKMRDMLLTYKDQKLDPSALRLVHKQATSYHQHKGWRKL